MEAVKTIKGRLYGPHCTISGNEPTSATLDHPHLRFIGGVHFLQKIKFNCKVQWGTLSQVPELSIRATNGKDSLPFKIYTLYTILYYFSIIILYDINALRFVKSCFTEAHATEYM